VGDRDPSDAAAACVLLRDLRAGGSTRQRTHETVARLKSETGIDAAAHLTCVAATQGEIDDVARAYWDAGIRHIVALRGDPTTGWARNTARTPAVTRMPRPS